MYSYASGSFVKLTFSIFFLALKMLKFIEQHMMALEKVYPKEACWNTI